MSVQSKVAYSFNKFYLNFLKDLKTNEELRPEIKKHYKVFDKFTTLHIEKLRDCNELIAGRSLESLLGVVDAAEHVTIKTYDVIFKILLHVFNDENATLNTLSTVIQTIKHIRDGDELSMEAFLDDDLSSMLTSLRELLAQDSKVNLNDLAPDTEDTFKLFENSMIGSLAKEISEEINIADLDIKDPTEFLKIENLSGNLKQSDLISEAMSLMGMLNNNSATSSIFNNVMSEMGKNMTAAHNGASTRARLQKKLAARKAE
jgi:hypothetical protein